MIYFYGLLTNSFYFICEVLFVGSLSQRVPDPILIVVGSLLACDWHLNEAKMQPVVDQKNSLNGGMIIICRSAKINTA